MPTVISSIGTSPRVATLAIVVTSACFGLVPLFARVLLGEGFSAEAIALYRFGLTLPLALFFLPRRRSKLRPAVALLAGGLAMGLGWTSYLRSLEHASVASAGVVYMSYPLFVVLIAWLIFREPFRLRSLLAALLVLAAALLAFAPMDASTTDWRYLAGCLPAPIGFGLIVVLIATVGLELSAMERWACVATGAVLGLLPISLVVDAQGLFPVNVGAWGWVAAMALMTAALPQVIYTFAAPRVGSARAAAAGTFELPTMFAIGWLAFAESVSFAQIGAGALIVVAVFLAPVLRSERAFVGRRDEHSSVGPR